MAQASNLTASSFQLQLVIKYKDNAFPKDKATITVSPGSYPFSAFTENELGIDGPIKKITVTVINRAKSGKVRLDDLSLLLLGPDTPRGIPSDGTTEYYPGTRIPLGTPRDGTDPLLPPPPPAIDGFRGQN